MAISDISLTAGMRNNLVSLQGTVDLLNRTQERLASGRSVNSPLDNATNYFVAKSHSDRASDLSVRKDGMGEAIQTVKSANEGISAITDLIASAKGIAQSALSAGTTERSTLAKFDSIRTQIDESPKTPVTRDEPLPCQGNEAASTNRRSPLRRLASTAAEHRSGRQLGLRHQHQRRHSTRAHDRPSARPVPTSTSIPRGSFRRMINVLSEGATRLTAADTNEEGANMLMLQVRQSLGTTALSLSAQAAQSVLRLF
jgi:flagellin-like hook-associated protein FlgL